jgi:hypothetical protein
VEKAQEKGTSKGACYCIAVVCPWDCKYDARGCGQCRYNAGSAASVRQRAEAQEHVDIERNAGP